MTRIFVGRHRELHSLDRAWNTQRSALIILFGRRRVGKTRLLTHWIKSHDGHGFYWMAEATSAFDQLRSFSQAIANFTDPETSAPLDFTYANWEQALRQIALLSRERRIAVFIDEVTYLMAVNASFVPTLQKVWDQWLSDANVMLALSGSQQSLMQRQLLAYDAPLYGRATVQMNLPPLPFSVSRQYFPDYSVTERVALYSIWGGVPAYWERIDPKLTPIENLRVQLEPSNAWLLDEPRLLLQDFLTDLYNYVGIMRAMAQGEETLSGISQRAGLSGGPASKYLSILRNTGFVDRRVPVTERSGDSRRGRYFVTDPYLRFYYRFLAAYQSRLAMGQQRQMMENIESSMPAFIESSTWQELCREWLVRAADNGQIPIPVEHVGSEWKRSFSIDVVGISESDRSLVLGCCLWRDDPTDIEPVVELVRRTSSIVGKSDGNWRVYFIGFASGGWTPAAETQATMLIAAERESRARRKWHAVGIRLIDLEGLDSDLAAWT